MPLMKTIGKKTAIVVSVAAMTAPETSAVPFLAASRVLSPCSLFRKMFSSTTMALSTSMPTASAMPPSDMMLSEISFAYISKKVPMTEIGIATAMIEVARESRRNPYSTIIARMPPKIAAVVTSLIAEAMNFD